MFVTKSIPAEHKDLIHDVAYDYHGRRMATCSSDQSVKASASMRLWAIIRDNGSWTSRTPAKSYPRQLIPEIRDSRLVPSLGGCLPSRTRDGSYPGQVVP